MGEPIPFGTHIAVDLQRRADVGNAGSNTAADHIKAARLALAQLPRGPVAQQR